MQLIKILRYLFEQMKNKESKDQDTHKNA